MHVIAEIKPTSVSVLTLREGLPLEYNYFESKSEQLGLGGSEARWWTLKKQKCANYRPLSICLPHKTADAYDFCTFPSVPYLSLFSRHEFGVAAVYTECGGIWGRVLRIENKHEIAIMNIWEQFYSCWSLFVYQSRNLYAYILPNLLQWSWRNWQSSSCHPQVSLGGLHHLQWVSQSFPDYHYSPFQCHCGLRSVSRWLEEC